MRNICISGAMGAGKSTVAKIICELAPQYCVSPMTKADQNLYKSICRSVDISDVTSRIAKQKIYECYRDVFGPAWFAKLVTDKERFSPEICDDVRCLAEVAQFEKEGWIHIHVKAYEEDRAERLKSRDGYDQREYFTHPKEIEALNLYKIATETIDNYGNIDALRFMVERILKSQGVIK